ncbi:MAG: DUF1461 domain-containing protein [Clostridia bacterium]
MKKFFSVGFTTIASLFLIFIVVFTSLQVIINDETFINNEFTKMETNKSMGMSNSDLVRSMARLVDFIEGDADNIDIEVTVNGQKTNMFSLEQEVVHMEDVRTIYLKIKNMRDFSVLAMLALFLFGAVINFRKAPQTISQGFLSGSFIALLFFGFLGTWAAMDFSSFWTFFHQMLFWNDLWLFDATESRMINMLPEQMFADIVGKIFLYAGIIIVLLIGLAVLCLVISSPSYQRKHAEHLQKKRAREKAKLARLQAKAEAKAAAEKEKRIAAKKALRAEREKRHAEAVEAKRIAAEKAARKADRAKQLAEQQRQSEATGATMKQFEPLTEAASAVDPARHTDPHEVDAAHHSERMERPTSVTKKKAPHAPTAKKRKTNINDDTGFLDD